MNKANQRAQEHSTHNATLLSRAAGFELPTGETPALIRRALQITEATDGISP